jgi:hypothetical protein
VTSGGPRLLLHFVGFDWDPAATVGMGWVWYVRLGLERGSELEPGLHRTPGLAEVS